MEFGEFVAMHDCKSNMIEFEAKGHGCMLESWKFGATQHEMHLRRGAEALLGRRAVRRRVRPARDKRAEVVSDSFASLFDCCESPSTRFHRVTSILQDNSVNSVGDTEARGHPLLCIWWNEGIDFGYLVRG